MRKILFISLLAALSAGCAAPQPATCDGGNLRPINQPLNKPAEESAQ